jgi:hypothetical protein
MYCYQSGGHSLPWSDIPSGKGWKWWKMNENVLFNSI